MTTASTRSINVISPTPDRWARYVLRNPAALLSDHLYLEKKAAINAMELLNRWQNESLAADWISTLSGIARDETQHLQMVGAVLNRRKAPIGRTHKNFYAADLRRLVRTGKGEQETLDRLLVSALIEARSCERFEVLEHLCTDPELRRLYRTLFASERGHFTAFLRLAEHDLPPETVEARWTELLAHEERIINEQAVGYRIHSGVPPE